MLLAENIFAIAAVIILPALGFIFKNKINWKNLGFKPSSLSDGLLGITIFTLLAFLFAQYSLSTTYIPDWVRDKDPILNLIVSGVIQEIIFRSILFAYLLRFGFVFALVTSSVIFAIIHLVLPDPWILTFLSLFGGLFWAWSFYNHRNIYLLIISHFLVNLSFNYHILFK